MKKTFYLLPALFFSSITTAQTNTEYEIIFGKKGKGLKETVTTKTLIFDTTYEYIDLWGNDLVLLKKPNENETERSKSSVYNLKTKKFLIEDVQAFQVMPCSDNKHVAVDYGQGNNIEENEPRGFFIVDLDGKRIYANKEYRLAGSSEASLYNNYLLVDVDFFQPGVLDITSGEIVFDGVGANNYHITSGFISDKGLLVAQSSEGLGVLNYLGEIKVPLGKYETIEPLEGGLQSQGFIVSTKDQVGLIGTNNEEIIPLGKYKEIKEDWYNEGNLICIDNNKTEFTFNLKTKKLIKRD